MSYYLECPSTSDVDFSKASFKAEYEDRTLKFEEYPRCWFWEFYKKRGFFKGRPALPQYKMGKAITMNRIFDYDITEEQEELEERKANGINVKGLKIKGDYVHF